MKAPEFWTGDGLLPRLLQPLGLAYQMGTAIRRHAVTPLEMDIPVLCVGNLVVGGAGKTPVALSLANLLKEAGTTAFAFLTRGHGGRTMGPTKVDPSLHGPLDIGDEALLLAETATTWVARDRAKGAMAARREGAELIIMDDGFQNPGLKKTLSIVVIDGGFGFGNGHVLPAGPLREPIDVGLSRADAVVIIDEDRTGLSAFLPDALPRFTAAIAPRRPEHLPPGTRVVGFAGIGRPTKFLETLKALDLDVIAFDAFSDHHVFTAAEIQTLITKAKENNAIPVTTAKDHVRLPRSAQALIQRMDISLLWRDKALLTAFLSKRLENGPG
jgi:tetraacyldisaccharide 4'-kinase